LRAPGGGGPVNKGRQERKGDGLNLPQFDGHFKKDTIEMSQIGDVQAAIGDVHK